MAVQRFLNCGHQSQSVIFSFACYSLCGCDFLFVFACFLKFCEAVDINAIFLKNFQLPQEKKTVPKINIKPQFGVLLEFSLKLLLSFDI